MRAIYVSQRIPNLVVLSKEHAGKADALNAGTNAARYPLVCTTDADAVLEKNALQRVARPFLERPRETVAVAGVVRIVNGARSWPAVSPRRARRAIFSLRCRRSSICVPTWPRARR
ncbi:MAG: glycosyltransferase [Thermoleophilia bacterium]